MKKIIIMATFIFGMLFISCNDAEYSVRDNSVYLAQAAAGSKTSSLAMETSGADINITVRLAKKANSDVTVEILPDTAVLVQYNEQNSSNYLAVPRGEYVLESSRVTIPAGEISATFKVHLNNFETLGKRYAFPVSIGNVQGGIEKSPSLSSFIYLINKPLIVSVPVMKGYENEGVKVHPNQDWGIRTKEWTIEAWVRMEDYRKNNQAIFSNWGDGLTEVYIRFGDANEPYNYLQVKTLGGQVETAKDLANQQWYHWAFVYDGTTLTIYRNGEQDVKFNPPAPQGQGGTVEFQTLVMIGSGATYFPSLCAMSQVRFWKVARTQSQIKNNMYYEVDPASTELIACWPMNEGSGNTFRDITGKGSDAVAGSHIIQRWEHNVRFDK
ncbi:MAG: DUF1735 and LamG domain-containing protein [Dysgonamonadaceae bacterium]|nr:DUF1735 and LamG domain-containing protein [Dysgonamonadaceae bacterium]